jgi:hypothetical protein
MRSSSREEIVEAFDALHTAVSGVLELSFDALTTPERLKLLQRLERQTRRLPAVGHDLINQLARQASEVELGGKLPAALANRLRITRADASRRKQRDRAVGRAPRQGLQLHGRSMDIYPARSGH